MDETAQTENAEPFLEPIFEETRPPALLPRQRVIVLLVALLCDIVIYRGHGYAGLSLLFVLAPILFCIGKCNPMRVVDLIVVAAMLVLISARLIWYGSVLPAALGFALLIAFAMTLSGLRPFVLEAMVFASQTIVSGYARLNELWQSLRRKQVPESKTGCFSFLAIGLPLCAAITFGLLFLLANPDLMKLFGDRIEWLSTALREWFVNYGPRPTEVLFWIAAIWIATGAICPLLDESLFARSQDRESDSRTDKQQAPAPIYIPFRNMLVTLIALFAVYLVFEFKTLWFKEFPSGFHYSGYAHEGAFWLTVALALATVILSLIFRHQILRDPRQHNLRRLSWIWSVENFLLAIAVYHRLLIYVNFNGMTRMRVVGFLGISAVVVGFILVLRKIATGRDFVWLVRRQLWTLFAAIYLFAVLPVDVIVMKYNVGRILDGDPAPCVQISVHPIDSDGVIQLIPLLDCDDEQIRRGLHALLSDRLELVNTRLKLQNKHGWTTFQWADRKLKAELERVAPRLSDFAKLNGHDRVLETFHKYAYQWF